MPVGTVVHFRALGNALPKQEGDIRSVGRRRVLKACIVASNDRRLTIACTVKDLSETGARLLVSGSVTVPDTFELIIDVDGLEANCEVVWRKAGELGVKYLGAPRKVAARRMQVINPIVPPCAPSLRRRPKSGAPI